MQQPWALIVEEEQSEFELFDFHEIPLYYLHLVALEWCWRALEAANGKLCLRRSIVGLEPSQLWKVALLHEE